MGAAEEQTTFSTALALADDATRQVRRLPATFAKDLRGLPCRMATTRSPEDIEAVATRILSMIGERVRIDGPPHVKNNAEGCPR